MSKCMTIADESIDQRDTCTEIAPKEIVEFVLEEILVSALIISDKGCSRIGDFNITEDFCQQYDRHQYLKDFEQVTYTGNPSAENQESNVNSGKSPDRPGSQVTAKENLELIIDSFVKKEDKTKPGGECTIISQEVLADNELQIQNGQSHIEKINRGKTFSEPTAREYFDKKDVIRDEKIEIQYYNEGKLSKIYVPLIPSSRLDVQAPLGLEKVEEDRQAECEDREEVASGQTNRQQDVERPFKPFTTEEFRQVWENINSSLVGRWDGDVSVKREEVGTLMEKLSSVQVFSDASVDPNRPRACAFGEEDVKKIIKEIEEISLTQSHANSEEFDFTYHPDGQGDADLESRSFAKSKHSLGRSCETDRPHPEVFADMPSCDQSSEDSRAEETEVFSSEELLSDDNRRFPSEKSISGRSPQFSSEKVFNRPEEQWTLSGMQMSMTDNEEPHSSHDLETSLASVSREHPTSEEESLAYSKACSDGSVKEDGRASHELNKTFTVDLPTERMTRYQRMQEDLDGESYSPFGQDVQFSVDSLSATSQIFSEKDPPIWTNGCDENHLTKTFEPTLEIDAGVVQDDSPVPDHQAGLNGTSEQTIRSLSLEPANVEGDELKMNSFFGTESAGNSTDSYVREPDPCADWCGNDVDVYRENADPSKVAERRDACLYAENLESTDVEGSKDGHQTSDEGTSLIFDKSLKRWSQKSLNYPKDINDKNTHFSTSSLAASRTENSSSLSLAENDVPECSRSQTFKLHSQKMYSGINHESDSQPQQECILTESEEAFIDETESVLQIIEPQELSEDENSSKVSFSLLCEISHGESSALADRQSEAELAPENNHSREFETAAKRVYSGMTTIGPLKNTDYDPKDLTSPNIDYGKMTRITSSRQLAKEIDMFGPELTSAASVKIVEEDSDNDLSLNLEDDRIEFTSLVNRDIASLTKVQKVREVMSHHPKLEDDFEDEDALPRPRLDLKDVESMTDERYKVPDVGIPLLSLEIGENNIGAEKEIIENMSLVLSGLTNPVYYDEDIEEDNLNSERQEHKSILDSTSAQLVEFPDEHDVDIQGVKTVTKSTSERISETDLQNAETFDENQGGNKETIGAVGSTSSQHDSNSPKYGTLGSVFRKASNKFIRKDGDLFLRNSKSLPRETAKITATDSIRSILDDCQSSASNMLKKSKSLLKNTQSIFKSISSSRVSSERDSGHNIGKKKLSPSESDVSTLERKLSSFLKKEEFAKAKNLIKSKVEKTLKNLDSGNSTTGDKVSPENKDLQVAIRDEEKLRVDRMENFRKLLPKSPLVYKSQFVKSQISVLSNSAESAEVASDCKTPVDDKPALNESRHDITSADETESQRQICSEIKIPLQENQRWSEDTEKLRFSVSEESEPEQPDYIVMETIQGLPTTDLESPSSEKENVRTTTTREEAERKTGNDDVKKPATASNSLQACADGVNDVAPCFPELDEEKMAVKTPSDRKMKTKKKKLTARFRSFWCSAFGRVKTPPKKGDSS